MTARTKVKKQLSKVHEKVNNRNHLLHSGVPIELPTNERLKEISDKFWDKSKRKRSGNIDDELQKDIDGIMKSIKVD